MPLFTEVSQPQIIPTKQAMQGRGIYCALKLRNAMCTHTDGLPSSYLLNLSIGPLTGALVFVFFFYHTLIYEAVLPRISNYGWMHNRLQPHSNSGGQTNRVPHFEVLIIQNRKVDLTQITSGNTERHT